MKKNAKGMLLNHQYIEERESVSYTTSSRNDNRPTNFESHRSENYTTRVPIHQIPNSHSYRYYGTLIDTVTTESVIIEEIITISKSNPPRQRSSNENSNRVILRPRVIEKKKQPIDNGPHQIGTEATIQQTSSEKKVSSPHADHTEEKSQNSSTESESENTFAQEITEKRMAEPFTKITSPTAYSRTFQQHDYYSGTYSTMSSGVSGAGQNLTNSIRETREREKKEMADLNDRLASYIEKVRFLEAQNKKMETDLFAMNNRWGSDTTNVRSMCDIEVKNAQEIIRRANKEREQLEDEIRNLMPQLTDLRNKFENAKKDHERGLADVDDLLRKLCDLEAEINLYKRRIALIEEEVARVKKDNQRLLNELNRINQTVEKESLSRLDFEHRAKALLDECQYIRKQQTSEMGDLLVHAHRDTTPENREYFKKELAAAMREVRDEYEQISRATRQDMEAWYRVKIQEIQTYSKTTTADQSFAREEIRKHQTTLKELRSRLCELEGNNLMLEKQIQELTYVLEDEHRMYESAISERDSSIRTLQEECQTLLLELQMLLDTKTTLDAEIAIYRKMLEGEENRAGLRQLVEQVVKTDYMMNDRVVETRRIVTSEASSRTNFQRSALGNLSITEYSPDGHYIVIQNNSRTKDEHMSEWKLKSIDKTTEHVFTFPKDFVLKPMKTVTIYARARGIHSPPASLVYNGDETWGTSSNVQIILYNKEDTERAKLIKEKSGVF